MDAGTSVSLPKFQTKDQSFALLQTSWASSIDPLLSSPLVNGLFLKNVVLINGVTTINHLLGRMQQGWMITDVSGAATVFRSQPLNDKTLVLTSNATVTVIIYVF